jgi:hypothetical protein
MILSRRLPILRDSLALRRCVGDSLMLLAFVGPGIFSLNEEQECRVIAPRDDSKDDDDHTGVALFRTSPEETCALQPAASLRTGRRLQLAARRTSNTIYP